MLSRLVCLEHNHDKDDARVTTPWWLMLPYHVDPRGSSSKPSAFGGTCSGHRRAASDEQDRRMAEQGSPTVLLLSNSGVERALWGRPGDGSGQGSECSRRWPRCVERFEAVVESLALRRGVS